jgi:ankyrin repeat protein
LLQAARSGDADVVKVLLDGGANPALAHLEGETPLMAASRSGSIDAVKYLLAKGVDVNAADQFQHQTPLMWAAAEGHAEVIDTLIKAGADPNKKARVNELKERKNADHPTGGFTALMWAARNGHDAAVRSLVKGGADMKLTNGDGATATVIAIFNDRFDIAGTLIELGSDPNDGSLYAATEMRDATTDQFAFDGSRLRINHPNKLTALDLIGKLLDRGADANKRFTGQLHSTSMPNSERYDNTPFFRSATSSDVEALKVFIAHGVDVNQVPAAAPPPPAEPGAAPVGGRGARGNPNAGRPATMITMTGGRGPGMTGGPGYVSRPGAVPWREPGLRDPAKAFEVLLKGGANPNAKGADGGTLLHQVVQAGNLEMLRALAEAGVKFDEKNNAGLTALDVAEGKVPEGGRGAGPGTRGGRGAAPPPAAGRGRGGGGTRGASQQEIAAELRKLMGLPPAPPPPAGTVPAVPQAEPEPADAAAEPDGDVQ